MTSILHRSPGSKLPRAVAGSGVWLIDSTGKRYLDASGGAAVSALGHGHPAIIAAIKEQVERLAYAHTAFFTNAPSEELAAFLIERAPAGFGKVYFCSGGSEAMETALKLARQYHVARGDTARKVFIARRQSYHGATLGALSVSGHAARRGPYGPILPPARFIDPCYAYRHQRADETAEEYGRRAADMLEAEILAAGPETVAAFIAEPVVGATMGAVTAAPGYLQRIREICDRHGVLMIADEVMCGMARTGTLFACDFDGVSPDIITLAKGLAAGYQPLGAVLMANHVSEAVIAGAGRFEHGHTYIGHAVACAAGLAVQRTIESEGLTARVAASGAKLKRMLADALGALDIVGDVRGRGLLLGVEFVADQASKTPFAGTERLDGALKAAAMAEGLIVYPGSGTADGVDGHHVLIAPPYIISDREMEELVERLARALQVAAPVAVMS